VGIEVAFNPNISHTFTQPQALIIGFDPIGGPIYALQVSNQGAGDSGRFGLDAFALSSATTGSTNNPNAAVRATITKGFGVGEITGSDLDTAILARAINPAGWLGWAKVDGIRVEMSDLSHNNLEMNGVEIASVTGATAAAVTGLKIGDQVSGASNFAIKTGLGKVVFGDTVRLPIYTVAGLPAGAQGDKALVSNALAPAFLAPPVGGGAVVCPVFHDGAVWRVG
jgi:hypothetical protein